MPHGLTPTVDAWPRFVNDKPWPNREHPRRAVELRMDPAASWPCREIGEGLVEPPQDKFGALYAAVLGNVVEKIGEVAFGVE